MCRGLQALHHYPPAPRVVWSVEGGVVVEGVLSVSTGHHLLPMAPHVALGEEVQCEVGGVRSAPLATGLTASPSSLQLAEDGGRAEVHLTLHTPLTCSNCSLRILVTTRNSCEYPPIHPSTSRSLSHSLSPP